MAIDLGSDCAVSALLADFCHAAGGIASAFRVEQLFNPDPNLLVFASGIGFEKSFVCGGLEIVAGTGVIAGSVFMRVMSRVCGFNWKSPSNRLRRLFGVALAGLSCASEAGETALGEIFSGPDLGPNVTLGLALGWLDIPIFRGIFPIAKATRALPSDDAMLAILNELPSDAERLSRFGLERREGDSPIVPQALFMNVARAAGISDPVATWDSVRAGGGKVPTSCAVLRAGCGEGRRRGCIYG